ncbi:uncharacterized protein APUU_21414S [Aspergillus puulaauensis]|uniref:Uncharacterized protein n=1 Tax=Aspergillus puulaauensis TaxID=1220207 RepID=A0A7R8AJU3_9EURO|nr:uncharacterized protein APUU_21414S [Aspergillus puulaauensis]BCS20982.1 hypothetical protein APUU_21414S [Aspergillus puulaauensis]
MNLGAWTCSLLTDLCPSLAIGVIVTRKPPVDSIDFLGFGIYYPDNDIRRIVSKHHQPSARHDPPKRKHDMDMQCLLCHFPAVRPSQASFSSTYVYILRRGKPPEISDVLNHNRQGGKAFSLRFLWFYI